MPLLNLARYLYELSLILLIGKTLVVLYQTQEVCQDHFLFQYLLVTDVLVLVIASDGYLSLVFPCDPGVLKGLLGRIPL